MLTHAACEDADRCCPPRPWAPSKQSRRLPLLSHFNSNPYVLRSCCQKCFPCLVTTSFEGGIWMKVMDIPCPSSEWHCNLAFYFCCLSGGPCLSVCFLPSLGFCLPLFPSLMFPKGFADVCTSFLGHSPTIPFAHTSDQSVCGGLNTRHQMVHAPLVCSQMCTRFCTLGLNFSTT